MGEGLLGAPRTDLPPEKGCANRSHVLSAAWVSSFHGWRYRGVPLGFAFCPLVAAGGELPWTRLWIKGGSRPFLGRVSSAFMVTLCLLSCCSASPMVGLCWPHMESRPPVGGRFDGGASSLPGVPTCSLLQSIESPLGWMNLCAARTSVLSAPSQKPTNTT